MVRRQIATGFILALFSALVVPSASFAQTLRPCSGVVVHQAGRQETARVPQNPIACRRAGHVTSSSAQIFNCRGAENGDGDMMPNKILLKPSGAPLRLLPIQDTSPDLTQMSLYDVDLGGTGQAEHVLALWQAQQNGFGTNFWIISVFDTSWNLIKTYDQVEDFGANHFVQRAGSCALAITKFERDETTSNVAPLYYHASFVGMVAGQMGAAPGLNPVKRRYTNAFQRQRLATFDRQSGLGKQGDLIGWMNARR